MQTFTKTQLIEKMRKQLEKDDQAKKALLRLYEYQTQSEKDTGGVYIENGVGFTKFDSEMLSSFAEHLLKKKFLSHRQMVLLKLKITKYAGQLVKLAIAKGLIVQDSRTSYHVAEEA